MRLRTVNGTSMEIRDKYLNKGDLSENLWSDCNGMWSMERKDKKTNDGYLTWLEWWVFELGYRFCLFCFCYSENKWYKVKHNPAIEIRDKSKQLAIIDIALASKEREAPEYIQMDEKNKKFKFVRIPKFEEVPYPVVMEPNLVIEYYSR